VKYQIIKFPAVGSVVLFSTSRQYNETPSLGKVMWINADMSHTQKVNKVELSLSFLQMLDCTSKLAVTAFV
jgi:hypothetical protein